MGETVTIIDAAETIILSVPAENISKKPGLPNRTQAYPTEPRLETHKSSELVFGSFMPPERLPNHEHLLENQQNQRK